MYEIVKKSDNQSDMIIQDHSEKDCGFLFWDLKALDKKKRVLPA